MKYPPLERRIIVDTREQIPWGFEFVDKSTGELHEYSTVSAKLDEGDYALEGAHNICAIERKSLQDYVSSITHGRDRFVAELERLQENVQHPFVFIEANIDQVLRGEYRNNVYPRAIVGSTYSFAVDFPAVHFVWCGSRRYAEAQALILFADIERDLKKQRRQSA